MKHVALLVTLLACLSTGCNRSTEPVSAQETTRNQSGSDKTDNSDNKTEPTLSDVPVADDARLQKYFERYCDYTGGMGIGFVASHTYDYKFRQHLKSTNDPELKRLFVLWHLYRELDSHCGITKKADSESGRLNTEK